ncbi:MAG: DUF2309 domain-containing protein [Planctomycetota bacterium]
MRPSIGRLRELVSQAARFLPSQGPITAFVHHNTLHAFEDRCFADAVADASEIHHSQPYQSEAWYHQQRSCGRIRNADIEQVLIDDLGEAADRLVANLGTRYALRLAMLRFPIRNLPDLEIRWLMTETDALDHFHDQVDAATSKLLIEKTRQWATSLPIDADISAELESWGVDLGTADARQHGSAASWESFTLRQLWRVCCDCVHRHPLPEPETQALRPRDLLLHVAAIDCDERVEDRLIPFCASFTDQGLSTWSLPHRDQGFLAAFAELSLQRWVPSPPWIRNAEKELAGLRARSAGRWDGVALELVQDLMERFGISEAEQFRFLRQTLLALPGWAGMIWQLEFNAPWAPRPAREGTFEEFLAVKLLLDFHAAEYFFNQELGIDDLRGVRDVVPRQPLGSEASTEQRAFILFQLSQTRGWSPGQLMALGREQRECLIKEVESFSETERRRTLHLAYERKYRMEALDAVIAHARKLTLSGKGRGGGRDDAPAESGSVKQRHAKRNGEALPAYQLVCCIDDREESFRRHLEEIDDDCETFGVAGFYGVAMYYRGERDAHAVPLCPVNITPQHFVCEEPAYSLAEQGRRQSAQRRVIGRASHRVHIGTRTLIGGLLTGLLGSFAAFPLVARILFPRTTARLRQVFGAIVYPSATQLRLERTEDQPSDHDGGWGYSLDEMADIIESVLRMMGMTTRLARLVVITGHGSSSLNNPHEAAYDCGACGGGRGGPNARAFAQMANDPRVRRRLAERRLDEHRSTERSLDEHRSVEGPSDECELDEQRLRIPDDVVFVGCYHNTSDDSVNWYDLDRLPATHRRTFERARDAVYAARERNAHERSRRFESADLDASPEAALAHVETRSEDLSQTRPECGHATNALCFVGRREWTRGLYLDRRAFLTSYDSRGDADGAILEGLLGAVIPVCAGINLEYYFSFVDPVRYGCGTKLPHNITSLVGVMDGTRSDLRTGLPWQMVEIHEPVRLMFVIESRPDVMLRIIHANPAIERLVLGGWVQLSIFDPDSASIHQFREGTFHPYTPESETLPDVGSSAEWYARKRQHLGFASIRTSEQDRFAIHAVDRQEVVA